MLKYEILFAFLNLTSKFDFPTNLFIQSFKRIFENFIQSGMLGSGSETHQEIGNMMVDSH